MICKPFAGTADGQTQQVVSFYAAGAVSFRDNSLSRSQVKITGVTIDTCSRELTMPPSTGVASGFITSAPVRVDHMLGNRPATTRDRVRILGRPWPNLPP